jgi:protein PhnA
MDIQLGFILETVAASVIRNIHLTDNADEIEGRTDKVKGLVLRTEFLKKA